MGPDSDASTESRRPLTTPRLTKGLFSPGGYIKRLRMLLSPWPRRLVVVQMLLMLQFRPQFLHRVSTQRFFPSGKQRLKKTSDPMDDFGLDRQRCSEIPKMDRVTVVQKGLSLGKSLVDQLPGPIYAVNWPEKLERGDVVNVTADPLELKRFVASDMFPILFLEICWFDEKGSYHARDAGTDVERYLEDSRIKRASIYHKAGPHRWGMPYTSGLACLVALNYFAKSIEVYGWDFYLTFPPARTGYWKAFFGMFWNPFQEIRNNTHVENAIFNWHYAHRFSHMEGFRTHGYLSELDRHKGINSKLDKIFYQS